MGVISEAFRNLTVVKALPMPQPFSGIQRAALPDLNYNTLAKEGYSQNELVFACIEELSTSAAEPRMMLRKRGSDVWQHEDHRLLDLLERPNPFMDRFDFFASVIMYRAIAGNAYAWIARTNAGRPAELWLLRPDRVKIVPSRTQHISHFEYDIGTQEPIRLAVDDVIHWKTRNPRDDYYGLPPMAAAAGRIDIDNYTKDLIKTTFSRKGLPPAILNIKGKMLDTVKKEIIDKYNAPRAGSGDWPGLLIVDNAEASFAAMTSNLGATGLVIPELDEIDEARIAMVFQVPLGLVGARLGMASSSYANRRSDRESFWDETLAPLYKSISGVLNLRLTPNYADVAEVAFDLSDVRALLEDKDKLHARERSDLLAGGITIEEFRANTGRLAKVSEGTYLIPSNLVPVPAEMLDDPAKVSTLVAPRPALPAPNEAE